MQRSPKMRESWNEMFFIYFGVARRAASSRKFH